MSEQPKAASETAANATATESTSGGHAPSKASAAEHLRFGHVDYNEIHNEDELERHYIFRRPRARQWFFEGKLHRSAEGHSAARFELFFDLVYVAIIATLAEACVEGANGPAFARYIVTYVPAVIIWASTRELINILWNDDVAQKTGIIWIMMLLIAYGNNAPFVADAAHEVTAEPTSTGEVAAELLHSLLRRQSDAPDSGSESEHELPGGGRTTAIVLYIIASASLYLARLFYSFYVPQYAKHFRWQSLSALVPLGLYIGAIFTSQNAAIALVLVGIVYEYAAWTVIFLPRTQKRFRFKYGSALNIEHEVDRHADFYTITMGEFLYSSIKGAPAGLGIDRATGRAVMVLMVAASLQLFYMLSSGCIKYVHPLRFRSSTAFVWFLIFIPAVAALTLAGDASAILIKYEGPEGVKQGVRWFWCGGISTGLICIWGLAMMEQDRDEGKLHMRKELRLLPRLAIALVILFLPLTSQERLSSTSLIGICAALTYTTLIWETLFSLHKPDSQDRSRGYLGLPRLFDPKLSDGKKEEEERERDDTAA